MRQLPDAVLVHWMPLLTSALPTVYEKIMENVP